MSPDTTSSDTTSATAIPLHELDGDAYPHDDKKKLAEAEAEPDSVSDGEDALPPAYDSLYAGQRNGVSPDTTALLSAHTVPNFLPSVQFQVETLGKSLRTGPIPAPADSIMIYLVGDTVDTAAAGSSTRQPAFISMRQSRWSGSHSLVAGGAQLGHGLGLSWGAGDEDGVRPTGENGRRPSATVLRTLSTTAYRFGPGRPPLVSMNFGDAKSGPSSSSSSPPPEGGSFEISRKELLSRTQRFTVPRLGTFEWRYAGRDERKAATVELGIPGDKINNLLVLDHVTQVLGSRNGPGSSVGNTTREVRRPVARLIRSNALRSQGTRSSTAGNGGRLQVDLRAWTEEEFVAGEDRKVTPEAMEKRQLYRDTAIVVAVTTCLVMLKKETDRRRGQQAGAMAAAGPC